MFQDAERLPPPMTEDEHFLATVTLGPSEWHNLRRLADGRGDFAPLALRAGLKATAADRLVQIGLAEKGACAWRYASRAEGYRLSALGLAVRQRGRFPSQR